MLCATLTSQADTHSMVSPADGAAANSKNCKSV
jgi:hypothetical protein